MTSNLVHETSFSFTDKDHHWRTASAGTICPAGLSANDELYLWGLLALTLAQAEPDNELQATPHYCLRQMGLIDQFALRGGQQYRQFVEAIERLAMVRYRCDHFYDPVRAEHRKVSFGFLSYSLPVDPQSNRAWRIVWDQVFFDLVRPVGGAMYFDLEIYRHLDPAARRLFLLLCKLFHRRRSMPRFDLRHVAVNILGFSPGIATADLKVKVWRCLTRMMEWKIVSAATKDSVFQKNGKGEYRMCLQRGAYFDDRQTGAKMSAIESPLHDPLQNIGLEANTISYLLRSFPRKLLQEWLDITIAAREKYGDSFFKKSAAAYFMDNVKHCAQGTRTPPDWWHDLRKAEMSGKIKARPPTRHLDFQPPLGLETGAMAAFQKVAGDVFGQFQAAGQSPEVARINAQKFAREYLRKHPDGEPSRPSGRKPK